MGFYLLMFMYVCMYLEEGSAIPWHGYGSRRIVYGSQFSLLPHRFWNATWALKFGSEFPHSPELSCRLLHV